MRKVFNSLEIVSSRIPPFQTGRSAEILIVFDFQKLQESSFTLMHFNKCREIF